MSLGLVVGVATALVFAGAIVFQLWSADLSADPDPESADFDADVHVLLRRSGSTSSRYTPAKTPSGYLRMRIYGSRIAIRCLGMPRWFAAISGLDLTLDGLDCDVTTSKISRRLSLPGTGDDYVVLAGHDRRRGEVEAAFRPRDGDIERLRNALVDAGVRPGEN